MKSSRDTFCDVHCHRQREYMPFWIPACIQGMGHPSSPPTRCIVFTCVQSVPIDLHHSSTSSFLVSALGNDANQAGILMRYFTFCFLNKCWHWIIEVHQMSIEIVSGQALDIASYTFICCDHVPCHFRTMEYRAWHEMCKFHGYGSVVHKPLSVTVATYMWRTFGLQVSQVHGHVIHVAPCMWNGELQYSVLLFMHVIYHFGLTEVRSVAEESTKSLDFIQHLKHYMVDAIFLKPTNTMLSCIMLIPTTTSGGCGLPSWVQNLWLWRVQEEVLFWCTVVQAWGFGMPLRTSLMNLGLWVIMTKIQLMYHWCCFNTAMFSSDREDIWAECNTCSILGYSMGCLQTKKVERIQSLNYEKAL